MKRLIALLTILCLACCTCALSEGKSTVESFSGTWPDGLSSALAGTPLAGAAPLMGYIGSQNGQGSHAAAVAQNADGYLLAGFTCENGAWQVEYAGSALRQDVLPQLWNQALAEEWPAEDIARYDGSEVFELIYPDARYTWQWEGEAWQLRRVVLPVANVVVNGHQLFWNNETVYTPQDTRLTGFMEAAFPRTLSQAQTLAADSPEDVTRAITASGGESGDFPVALHAAPTTGSDIIGYYASNVPALVLDSGSGFVQLEIDGVSGWATASQAVIGSVALEATAGLPGQIYSPSAAQGKYRSLLDAPNAQASGIATLGVCLPVRVLGCTADGGYLHVQLDGGLTGYLPADAVSAGECRILSDTRDHRLNLRQEPSTKAQSLGKYYGGVSAIRLFAPPSDSEWQRVCVFGHSGWMLRSFLSTAADTAPDMLPPLGQVQHMDDGGLNLRAEPGYQGEILARYPEGSMAEILGVISNWAHVRMQDGAVGYMLLTYLGGEPVMAVKNAFALSQGVTLITLQGTQGASLAAGDIIAFPNGRPCPDWHYDSLLSTMVFQQENTVAVQAAQTSGLIRAEDADTLCGVWRMEE